MILHLTVKMVQIKNVCVLIEVAYSKDVYKDIKGQELFRGFLDE